MVEIMARRRLHRTEAPRTARATRAGAHAMIIVMTVVMLLTFITLAIFTQAVQQLPLAARQPTRTTSRRWRRPRPGSTITLNHLNQNSNLLGRTTRRTRPRPTATQAFTDAGCRLCPAADNNGESFRADTSRRDTSKTGTSGTIYLTSSGKRLAQLGVMAARALKVGIRLRRDGFLDFLYMTDYEIVDPALSGDPGNCVFRAWERNTASPTGYGPDPSSCSIVYWTDAAALTGPVHTNDGLYVCGAPQFHGDTDTYYNSPVSQSVVNSTKFGGPGVVLNPLGCTNTPIFDRLHDPASGANLQVPAREHRDSHAGRRQRRRRGLSLYGPDDDHAPQLRQRRADGRGEPVDEVDQQRVRARHQLEPSAQRRHLRADHPELLDATRTTRRVQDPHATATRT